MTDRPTGTPPPDSHSEAYAAAGVDITAGYRAVDLMKKHVARTNTAGVVSGLGGFGGLFAPNLEGMTRPVLVSGTDGVGTKLKLAFALDKHDTVGIDCVAMCVNDIVCSGAMPLFFLDYIALGKNVPEQVEQIVAGVAEGCVQAGAALVGGETAEMPGFYPEGEYDMAGFAVGIVDADAVLDPREVRAGDVVIGLASSGVHSNGFSLVRAVIPEERFGEAPAELGGQTIGEALLEPTRIYVPQVRRVLEKVRPKSIAHITGGGLYENLPRALGGKGVRIEKAALEPSPLFDIIARAGDIPERDMYNTFNMGVGLAIVVAPEDVQATLDAAGEGRVIGEVVDAGGADRDVATQGVAPQGPATQDVELW